MPVSEELITEAQRLHDDGVSLYQIAAQLGINYSTLYRRLNPEYAERQRFNARQWKQRQRGRCERCGGVTRYNGHDRHVSRFCAECSGEMLAAYGRSTRGSGPTIGRVLRLMSDGKERSYSEIRDAVGISDERMASMLYGRLLRYGLVRRVSRGVYVLAEQDVAPQETS